MRRLRASQDQGLVAAADDQSVTTMFSNLRAKPGAATSIARQVWLENGVKALRVLFKQRDYEVPANVRVSIGWPKGSHGRGRPIGQCWSVEASSDKHAEIFISPELGTKTSSVRILGTLAHELAHAICGHEAGHKAPFKRCATAVGLEGPMTATTEGAEFVKWAKAHIAKVGPYPAGTLSLLERKKQSTRLIKCECAECGYVARVTRKWIDEVGAPHCPDDGEMTCE
jgi:hypothetical protein